MEAISDWFAAFGSLTPAAGAALLFFFLVTALVALPRALLILTAGATFGLKATPIILLGATAGGIISFLLSRHVASAWFRSRIVDRKPMLRAIAHAVDDEGWRIVALVRLGAPIPSSIQGYLFGLTNIPLVAYSVATFIFSAPQVFLFTFLGATGRTSFIDQSSLALSLLTIVVTITTIALLGWRVKQLLRPHLATGDRPS